MSRRALSMLAEQTLGRWAIGVSAVLLAISGAFGGWERVEPPPAKPGTPIDGGAWTVTIADARLVGDYKPLSLSRKENHWIAVVATVEIKAEQSWQLINNIIQLPPTEGIENDKDGLTPARSVLLLRDATIIEQLHPGMPEKVAFFWERKKDSPVPSELRVVVTAREFRENSLTFGQEWMPAEDAYSVATMPVLDKRDETTPSPTPSPSPRPSTTPSTTVKPSSTAKPSPTVSPRRS